MNSKYIYSIAIIIVLLVLLFIYNASKGAPTTNSNPSGKPGPGPNVVVKSSLQVMCNSLTSPYSFTISITDSNKNTTSNTITSSSAGAPTVTGDFIGGTSASNQLTTGTYRTIGGVQYAQTYLNFYENLNTDGNTSKFAIQDITTYITSITDTNTSQIIYDATTGTIANNKLIFTAGSDSLTIEFGSPQFIPANSLTPSSPISLVPTLTIAYTPVTQTTSSILTIVASNNLTSIFPINYEFGVNMMFDGSFRGAPFGTVFDIYCISFDSYYLYLIGSDFANQHPSQVVLSTSLGFSANDTSQSQPPLQYDVSTMTVNNNTLTLTSIYGTLTVSFPNPFQ